MNLRSALLLVLLAGCSGGGSRSFVGSTSSTSTATTPASGTSVPAATSSAPSAPASSSAPSAPASSSAPSAPASSSAPSAPASSSAPAAPAPVTTTITGTVSGTTSSLLLASSRGSFELVGPRATDLAATLGIGRSDAVSGLPVAVTGTISTSTSQVVVASYDLEAAFTRKTLSNGVVWKKAVLTGLYKAKQTVNVLVVDTSVPGVKLDVAAATSTAGETTSHFGKRLAVKATFNGGYFDSSHKPTGLLKIDGQVKALLASGKPARTAFGVDAAGHPLIARVPAGDAWAPSYSAIGAGPTLVTASAPDNTRVAEGYIASFDTGRHPRTAAGYTASGTIVLVTVDGRTSAGAGMTLNELARTMIVLGCEKAMNLDGGGSTTFWLASQGVVNRPSDGTERAVGNVLTVDWP